VNIDYIFSIIFSAANYRAPDNCRWGGRQTSTLEALIYCLRKWRDAHKLIFQRSSQRAVRYYCKDTKGLSDGKNNDLDVILTVFGPEHF